MTEAVTAVTGAEAPPLGGRASFPHALSAIYTSQVSRARYARAPLLFVATLQSLGILALLRGVAAEDRGTARAVVAGATVLVVAFVALNLLAQRLGALRAANALDHYAALPVSPAAFVLGVTASYATFTVPGSVVTAVAGALLFGLPLGNVWVVLPAVVAAGAALAGIGACLGLLLPRPELATVAGQLGMTLVLFLGVIPPDRMPLAVRGVRAVLPSSYAVDALAEAFRADPRWGVVAVRLVVCLAVGAVALALATRAFRRAVAR